MQELYRLSIMSYETPALPRASCTPAERACASTFFTQDEMVKEQSPTATSSGSEQLMRSHESGRLVSPTAAHPQVESGRKARHELHEDARLHASLGASPSRYQDQCGICHDSAADIIQAATTSGLFAQHAIWKCTHEHCDKCELQSPLNPFISSAFVTCSKPPPEISS